MPRPSSCGIVLTRASALPGSCKPVGKCFFRLIDHCHKTDLLVSDGGQCSRIQIKTIEAKDEHTEVVNKWKGSAVHYVVYFAKNSNWGYIIPAFTTNRKKLDVAGGQKF
jgi:hypothetical protein